MTHAETEPHPAADTGAFRDVAIAAARAAGRISRAHFQTDVPVRFKSRKDLVTTADVASEEKIVQLIAHRFPAHGIAGEELPPRPSDSPYQWIIDPIDGTTNYVAGLPFFSVCLVLCHAQEAILAVIYDPLRDELFCAEKGLGASLNGHPLAVSRTTQLQDCVVSYGRSYHPTAQVVQAGLDLYGRLLPRVRGMRQLGGSALDFCYVAAGRLDATLTPHTAPGLEHPAGCLLVEEAGGRATSLDGEPWNLASPSIAASNGRIHGALLESLRD